MNRHQTKYKNTAEKMNRALIELLKEKPFISITIKEVCLHAIVNRSTFYSHYQNMADLLEDTRNYITNLFVDTSVTWDAAAPNAEQTFPFYKDEFLIPVLKVFEENRSLFLIPYFYPDSFQYPEEYNRILEQLVVPYLNQKGIQDMTTIEYIMQYYYSGIHAIIYKWLRGGCKESYTDVANFIRMCTYELTLQSVK